MKCLVTGAAGFIGSHLCEELLGRGEEVTGVDCFTRYYPRRLKERNIDEVERVGNFKLIRADLAVAKIEPLLEGVGCVYHLAAQPGVRPSWGELFAAYVRNNILATQKLLEASVKKGVRKFVYASSSSVYGDAEKLPTPENTTPSPISPYGVTKLVGEQLCDAYRKTQGLSATTVRYFTVYGPRQRPDMAFNKFITAISRDKQVNVFGDGQQQRDFTFVDDAVRATVLASGASAGSTYNIGSGKPVKLLDVIELISQILVKRPNIRFAERARGDVRATAADSSRLRLDLGWRPKVALEDGLRRQVEWQLQSGRRRT